MNDISIGIIIGFGFLLLFFLFLYIWNTAYIYGLSCKHEYNEDEKCEEEFILACEEAENESKEKEYQELQKELKW